MKKGIFAIWKILSKNFNNKIVSEDVIGLGVGAFHLNSSLEYKN